MNARDVTSLPDTPASTVPKAHSASIFISYAKQDVALAEAVARHLERAGYEVWWDFRLIAGSPYRLEIAERIDSATMVVVIWSPHSIKSAFVIDEATRALEQSKLVPISVGNTKPPLGFGQLHTLFVSSIEKDIDRIVAAIEGHTVVPSRGPAFGGKWVRRALIATTLAAAVAGSALLLMDNHHIDRAVNCVRYGCELNYATYRSRTMGVQFVYPQQHLTLVTMREHEHRLAMINHKSETEITIFRSPLPQHRDPIRANKDEEARLTEAGYRVTYMGPQIEAERKRFYVIAGRHPDGRIFYNRRWFTDRDMVSAEYVYAPEFKALYDKIIVDMVVRSMRISEPI